MIVLLNRDQLIYDFPQRVADIIKEYQTTGKINISTNKEGISLWAAGVYKLLDYVCEQFAIDKSLVSIYTPNREENHPEYNIVIINNRWIQLCKTAYTIPVGSKGDNLKTVGCFFGKPNWHRLVLSAWIYQNYKDQALQTMHYNTTIEMHNNDSGLTDIIKYSNIEEIELVSKFIRHCPLTLNEGFIEYTIGPDKHYNIIPYYSDIFLDLVNETYTSGLTFFPTEKTLRPIIARTPFITMGPQGFIENLKVLGFKTFDKWWDESYDNYQGYERIQKIKKTLTDIFTWDSTRINDTIQEMNSVLDHNYNLLKTL